MYLENPSVSAQLSPPEGVLPGDGATDAALVERCLGGDMDAFAGIMDRYQGPVFHGVLRMVGNYEDAQELCQQVFLKAFEHLHTYDPGRRFFSWIYRVAMNESINHLKARRFHDPILDGQEPMDGSPGAMEHLENLHRQQDLRRALARLEPKYVAVITLFHFLHKSYEEIAETLDLPEKTVKSRLYMARQLLRETLEGFGHGR